MDDLLAIDSADGLMFLGIWGSGIDGGGCGGTGCSATAKADDLGVNVAVAAADMGDTGCVGDWGR